MKVKVISLPYIFQVLYVLCFTRPRYQVSVYRTIGPLYSFLFQKECETGELGTSGEDVPGFISVFRVPRGAIQRDTTHTNTVLPFFR